MRALAPVLRLIALGVLSFKTYRLHPLAPTWKREVIRLNELRNPMPQRRTR